MFCFCYVHTISFLYCAHLCMKYFLGILIFLKRALVFPIVLFSSILHWSLRKAFFSLLAILWNSAFKWVCLSFSPLLFASLLFSAICKASSDNKICFTACRNYWGLYTLGVVFWDQRSHGGEKPIPATREEPLLISTGGSLPAAVKTQCNQK